MLLLKPCPVISVILLSHCLVDVCNSVNLSWFWLMPPFLFLPAPFLQLLRPLVFYAPFLQLLRPLS
uniref:Uncharacterized protein n=1 Tax=Anguilla anguilla TaxID=7936 RepID=A0A0E9XHQ4_ANGAN